MGFFVPWAPDLFWCKYWIASMSWSASIYNPSSWAQGNSARSRGGRRTKHGLSWRREWEREPHLLFTALNRITPRSWVFDLECFTKRGSKATLLTCWEWDLCWGQVGDVKGSVIAGGLAFDGSFFLASQLLWWPSRACHLQHTPLFSEPWGLSWVGWQRYFQEFPWLFTTRAAKCPPYQLCRKD